MTLREIAQQAGVSVATVSRVVNGVDRGKVSEDTRRRVLEIAKSARYRPNPQAVSLVTRRPPNTLGLVIPYNSHVFESFYFTETIRGAVDAAAERGMNIALFMPGRDAPSHVYQDTLGKGGALGTAAGVLLIGTRVDDPAIHQCREAEIPFVVVSSIVPDKDVSSVDCDNVTGAMEATRHLLQLGHKRIAYIAGPEGSANAQDRYRGYEAALKGAGIAVDPALVACGEFEEQRGRYAMQRILARGVAPTAVFAANDVMALGAMKALKHVGLRVPDDVAIVGFDDIPPAVYVEPALTTVHQPIYQIGKRAAAMLAAQVLDRNAGSSHDMLRTRLVVRESCGARKR